MSELVSQIIECRAAASQLKITRHTTLSGRKQVCASNSKCHIESIIKQVT